jgi:CRP-like cAMP-binding protein
MAGGDVIEVPGAGRASARGRAVPLSSAIARAGAGGGDGDVDVAALLADRVDAGSFRPRLAADIERKVFPQRWGTSYVMLANPRDLLHLRLDPETAEQTLLMDGTRTVNDILVERLEVTGGLELNDVLGIVDELRRNGFLDRRFIDVASGVDRALHPPRLRTRVVNLLRTLRLEWDGADRLVRWVHRHGARWLLLPVSVWAGIVVALVGVGFFVATTTAHRFGLSGGHLAYGFVLLLFLNILLTMVHELGHAVTLVHFGRRIKSAGVMIYFGSPAFFVESSDGLMLDRWKRIAQAFAGPWAELVVAGAASIVVGVWPGWFLAPLLFKFAALNYLVITMNLIPLLELDGYWIFSDLVQIPDLRPASLAFVRRDLLHKLRSRARFSGQELALAVYGTLGVAFAIFSLFTGFFFWREVFGAFVSEMWKESALTRVLLLVLAVLLLGPLLQALAQGIRALGGRVRAAWRAATFRLQRSWRIEAATMIDDLPLFDDLPEDLLSELAGHVRLRPLARRQAAFRQGDRPTAFFVVRRGSVEIVEEDPGGGAERVLRTIPRGGSFGELGLLDGGPRSATARAVGSAELYEVGKGVFDALLANAATAQRFAPTAAQAGELRGLPCFAALSDDQLVSLLDEGAWVNLAPGDVLMREGEPGDVFWAIGSGRVRVRIGGKEVRTLGAGSHVGEMALLSDAPRTATVDAVTPVRAFRLPRAGFDRIVSGVFRSGAFRGPAEASGEHLGGDTVS